MQGPSPSLRCTGVSGCRDLRTPNIRYVYPLFADQSWIGMPARPAITYPANLSLTCPSSWCITEERPRVSAR